MQDLGRDFQAQSMKFLFWLVMVLGKAEVKNQMYDGCGNSGMDMDCPLERSTFAGSSLIKDSKF